MPGGLFDGRILIRDVTQLINGDQMTSKKTYEKPELTAHQNLRQITSGILSSQED
jgi:hypothetical protein